MNSSKVLLGVLSGVAVGAIGGILFTPKKGLKTRKKILDKGNDLADKMKEKFESLFESMSQKQENVWQAEADLITEGITKLNSLKKEIINTQ
jgi:gas vesicle protein